VRILLLIFIVIFLLVSGCKNKSTQPLETQNKNLLHKTYSTLNTYTEYFYNNSNKLIKVESYYNGTLERKSEYEYNKNNCISKENTFINIPGVPEYSYSLYEYDEHELVSNMLAYLKISDGSYELRSYTKFKYNTDNRLIRSSIFNSDSVEVKYTEFIYDEIGNVIETNFYQNGDLSFNEKYEYDNMNNPFKELTMVNSVYNISQNNVIKHSQINYMSGNNFSTTVYTYQYNENGYPTNCSYDSQKYYFDYY
jgi:hypothetical protein